MIRRICCVCGAEVSEERIKCLLKFAHGVLPKRSTCSPECGAKFRKIQFKQLGEIERAIRGSVRAKREAFARGQAEAAKNLESLARPLRPPSTPKPNEEEE
jgi:hypothetical protein